MSRWNLLKKLVDHLNAPSNPEVLVSNPRIAAFLTPKFRAEDYPIGSLQRMILSPRPSIEMKDFSFYRVWKPFYHYGHAGRTNLERYKYMMWFSGFGHGAAAFSLYVVADQFLGDKSAHH